MHLDAPSTIGADAIFRRFGQKPPEPLLFSEIRSRQGRPLLAAPGTDPYGRCYRRGQADDLADDLAMVRTFTHASKKNGNSADNVSSGISSGRK